MTLGDLIGAFRDEAGDKVNNPYFWPTKQLTKWANEGETEACRRAQLLIDSTSPSCSVPVVAGTPVVGLDPVVLCVMRARMDANPLPMAFQTLRDMDACALGWESVTGKPVVCVTDYQSGAIRLYPSPSEDGTLLLTISRLPSYQMESDTDEPEIRPEHHPALVQWMLYRAYAKQDADTFDPRKSASALAEFEREFGSKASARNELWSRGRPDIVFQPIA